MPSLLIISGPLAERLECHPLVAPSWVTSHAHVRLRTLRKHVRVTSPYCATTTILAVNASADTKSHAALVP